MENKNISVSDYLRNRILKETFDEWIEDWLTSVLIDNKHFRIHQVKCGIAIASNKCGQIIIPTGGGKTLIEIGAIMAAIISFLVLAEVKIGEFEGVPEGEIPVFTVVSPKINLSRQLFNVIEKAIGIQNVHFLIVDSGKVEQLKHSKRNGLGVLTISTTSPSVIKDHYEIAKKHKLPMIIISTYDSAYRIVESSIPRYMLLCDEAHHVVEIDNAWIPEGLDYNGEWKRPFGAYRSYYFTATRKVTPSDEGNGMNNPKFGPIIFEIEPLDLVKAGEIVGPKLHIVREESKSDKITENDESVSAVKSSFDEHQKQLDKQTDSLDFDKLGIPKRRLGAKMLVGNKNSNHLEDFITHKEIQDCINNREDITIFDTTSRFGDRINGKVVTREEFLKALKDLKPEDKAIIFHIKILREGIDVAGITGVYFTTWGSLINFLQSFGRATRLHDDDRTRLYSGKMSPNEHKKFVKPWAWVIIPVFDEEGEDLRFMIYQIVSQLMMFGFRADQDVVVSSPTRADKEEEDDSSLPDDENSSKAKALFNWWVNFIHEIEEIIVEKERKSYLKRFSQIKESFEEILEALKL